jgi:hypothetical protein
MKMIGLIVAFIIVSAMSSMWAYDDAEKRGKSGILAVLLVLFVLWPIGLILWLVFRPKLKDQPSAKEE